MNDALKNKIIAYYTKYYRDECSLKDWKKRVEDRLNEEQFELEKVKKLQNLLGMSFQNQKHFVFEAGTGGLAIVLHKEFGCSVYGIEPSEQEFEIIQDKCREEGINTDQFKKEYGENYHLKIMNLILYIVTQS